ncbi:MAG: TIGR04255 family protein [Saprospiraceae bacterium]|nr:TIGR04255 family protein [Saprospiraceae bacterium]MBP6565692.1 TIGR04255 family protein [Saprospiraceae bacterium]
MNHPIKISPDHLKETIVEIRYTSKVPFEVAIGLFFSKLDDSYIYSGLGSKVPADIENISKITFRLEPGCIFYNDKIRVECLKNKFIFNATNISQEGPDYPGWSIYSEEIRKILTFFEEAGVIQSYKWVGLRYISEYPEMSLQDISYFSQSTTVPEGLHPKNIHSRQEYIKEDCRIILGLNQNETNGKVVSVIDIDVIKEVITTKSLEELIHILNSNHDLQKDVFFTLLNKTYFSTLKVDM